MKVRCIDNENIYYGMLSLGTIYEVHNRNQFNYEVIDDSGRYIYFNKERFEEVNEELDFVKEVVEECLKEKELREKNKTEKTFREVIADIKEDEVWESSQNCFQLKEIRCVEGRVKFKLEGVFVEKTDNSNNVNTGEGLSQTFKLQRKQYSFEEAFKAYEEGKEIESCIKNFKIKKLNNKPHYIYKHMSEWDYINNDDACFSIDEIQGKWYINN